LRPARRQERSRQHLIDAHHGGEVDALQDGSGQPLGLFQVVGRQQHLPDAGVVGSAHLLLDAADSATTSPSSNWPMTMPRSWCGGPATTRRTGTTTCRGSQRHSSALGLLRRDPAGGDDALVAEGVSLAEWALAAATPTRVPSPVTVASRPKAKMSIANAASSAPRQAVGVWREGVFRVAGAPPARASTSLSSSRPPRSHGNGGPRSRLPRSGPRLPRWWASR
jgi:hypothetical protein